MLSQRYRVSTLAVLALTLLFMAGPLCAAQYKVVQTLDIDKVPSSFQVGFCLLTHGKQQYAAYYDAEHQMVVASRELDSTQWQKKVLPTKVGWDSHNYITMTIDADGQLHVSGNMHGVPLIYFRTRVAGDITTLEKASMTGQDEQRCTYPRFLNDAEGNLLFMYRSGGSGNGRRFINRYDLSSQTWHRFLDTPIFEGQGLRNAYPIGPVQGPDGLFHMIWVWRDTPDCATNHNLSYVRSRDLKHWETASGLSLKLPITLDQTDAVVDPVPAGGGIINSGIHLTFDSKHRPLISYHKRDHDNHMQLYVARPEQGVWKLNAITNWDKEIPFSGGGSMGFIGISASGLTRVDPNTFLISYRHQDYGSGQIVLEEETLEPIDRKVTLESDYPATLYTSTVDYKGISVRIMGGQDLRSDKESSQSNVRYVLKWETLGVNRDRPHAPPLPPPSTLRLIELRP